MSAPACDRFDRAAEREDPAASADLQAHAAVCPECRARLALWGQIAEAAPAMRKSWDSPELWPRIEREMARSARPAAPRESSPWIRGLAAAAVVALVLLSAIGVRVFRDRGGREPLANLSTSRNALLSEDALRDVEAAEDVYLGSIEKLSQVARPRLENPDSAVAAAYKEKLLVLDSEISEMRGEIERNRFNTHLRKELLAIYREKQRTLQDLMKVGQS